MAYGRIQVSATTLRDYLATHIAASTRMNQLDDVTDAAIRWSIQQRYPDISTIFHKNEQDFGDNEVWYFGPPGDVAVEIGGSFLRARTILREHPASTVTDILVLLNELLTASIPLPATPASEGIFRGDAAPRSPTHSSGRMISVLALCIMLTAIALYTLTGYLFLQGIVLVPALVSLLATGAILVTAAQGYSRTHRR